MSNTTESATSKHSDANSANDGLTGKSTGHSKQYVYFEDFTKGDLIELAGWSVTKEEVIEFATQFDPQPFHLDEQAGRESPLGGLAASGWHTVSAFMRSFVNRVLEDAMGMGSPGIDYLNWLYPVYPGDTITGRLKIIETRVSNSNPSIGLVKFALSSVNQKGTKVLEMEFPMMFARKNS